MNMEFEHQCEVYIETELFTFFVRWSVWSLSIWDIFSPSVSSGSKLEGFRQCASAVPAAGNADAVIPHCNPT